VVEVVYIDKYISKVHVLKYLEQGKAKCLPTCELKHTLKNEIPWVENLSCFSSVVCIPSKQNFKVHLVEGCEGLAHARWTSQCFKLCTKTHWEKMWDYLL
jgi:hypothetical protein